MSPRAAWRLEQLGFQAVYEYVAGKADWIAAGLPTEGPGSATPRPGGIARRRVATCSVRDSVGEARRRVSSSDWTRVVVVNHERVVLGLLDEERLSHPDANQTTVETVMRVGPTTVRAHDDLKGLIQRMHVRQVSAVLVTNPEGRLLGVLIREDADRVLGDRASTST